jgi:uncharacterized protein (DUF433 family)
MAITAPSHITIDDTGVARIDGTRMKVIHVAKERVARGLTPEQIQEAFPILSLAQVHAALSYYYDHQSEMDRQIRREFEEAEAARQAAQETPGRQKLRDRGHLP